MTPKELWERNVAMEQSNKKAADDELAKIGKQREYRPNDPILILDERRAFMKADDASNRLKEAQSQLAKC